MTRRSRAQESSEIDARSDDDDAPWQARQNADKSARVEARAARMRETREMRKIKDHGRWLQ